MNLEERAIFAFLSRYLQPYVAHPLQRTVAPDEWKDACSVSLSDLRLPVPGLLHVSCERLSVRVPGSWAVGSWLWRRVRGWLPWSSGGSEDRDADGQGVEQRRGRKKQQGRGEQRAAGCGVEHGARCGPDDGRPDTSRPDGKKGGKGNEGHGHADTRGYQDVDEDEEDRDGSARRAGQVHGLRVMQLDGCTIRLCSCAILVPEKPKRASGDGSIGEYGCGGGGDVSVDRDASMQGEEWAEHPASMNEASCGPSASTFVEGEEEMGSKDKGEGTVSSDIYETILHQISGKLRDLMHFFLHRIGTNTSLEIQLTNLAVTIVLPIATKEGLVCECSLGTDSTAAAAASSMPFCDKSKPFPVESSQFPTLCVEIPSVNIGIAGDVARDHILALPSTLVSGNSYRFWEAIQLGCPEETKKDCASNVNSTRVKDSNRKGQTQKKGDGAIPQGKGISSALDFDANITIELPHALRVKYTPQGKSGPKDGTEVDKRDNKKSNNSVDKETAESVALLCITALAPKGIRSHQNKSGEKTLGQQREHSEHAKPVPAALLELHLPIGRWLSLWCNMKATHASVGGAPNRVSDSDAGMYTPQASSRSFDGSLGGCLGSCMSGSSDGWTELRKGGKAQFAIGNVHLEVAGALRFAEDWRRWTAEKAEWMAVTIEGTTSESAGAAEVMAAVDVFSTTADSGTVLGCSKEPPLQSRVKDTEARSDLGVVAGREWQSISEPDQDAPSGTTTAVTVSPGAAVSAASARAQNSIEQHFALDSKEGHLLEGLTLLFPADLSASVAAGPAMSEAGTLSFSKVEESITQESISTHASGTVPAAATVASSAASNASNASNASSLEPRPPTPQPTSASLSSSSSSLPQAPPEPPMLPLAMHELDFSLLAEAALVASTAPSTTHNSIPPVTSVASMAALKHSAPFASISHALCSNKANMGSTGNNNATLSNPESGDAPEARHLLRMVLHSAQPEASMELQQYWSTVLQRSQTVPVELGEDSIASNEDVAENESEMRPIDVDTNTVEKPVKSRTAHSFVSHSASNSSSASITSLPPSDVWSHGWMDTSAMFVTVQSLEEPGETDGDEAEEEGIAESIANDNEGESTLAREAQEAKSTAILADTVKMQEVTSPQYRAQPCPPFQGSTNLNTNENKTSQNANLQPRQSIFSRILCDCAFIFRIAQFDCKWTASQATMRPPNAEREIGIDTQTKGQSTKHRGRRQSADSKMAKEPLDASAFIDGSGSCPFGSMYTSSPIRGYALWFSFRELSIGVATTAFLDTNEKSAQHLRSPSELAFCSERYNRSQTPTSLLGVSIGTFCFSIHPVHKKDGQLIDSEAIAALNLNDVHGDLWHHSTCTAKDTISVSDSTGPTDRFGKYQCQVAMESGQLRMHLFSTWQFIRYLQRYREKKVSRHFVSYAVRDTVETIVKIDMDNCACTATTLPCETKRESATDNPESRLPPMPPNPSPGLRSSAAFQRFRLHLYSLAGSCTEPPSTHRSGSSLPSKIAPWRATHHIAQPASEPLPPHQSILTLEVTSSYGMSTIAVPNRAPESPTSLPMYTSKSDCSSVLSPVSSSYTSSSFSSHSTGSYYTEDTCRSYMSLANNDAGSIFKHHRSYTECTSATYSSISQTTANAQLVYVVFRCEGNSTTAELESLAPMQTTAYFSVILFSWIESAYKTYLEFTHPYTCPYAPLCSTCPLCSSNERNDPGVEKPEHQKEKGESDVRSKESSVGADELPMAFSNPLDPLDPLDCPKTDSSNTPLAVAFSKTTSHPNAKHSHVFPSLPQLAKAWHQLLSSVTGLHATIESCAIQSVLNTTAGRLLVACDTPTWFGRYRAGDGALVRLTQIEVKLRYQVCNPQSGSVEMCKTDEKKQKQKRKGSFRDLVPTMELSLMLNQSSWHLLQEKAMDPSLYPEQVTVVCDTIPPLSWLCGSFDNIQIQCYCWEDTATEAQAVNYATQPTSSTASTFHQGDSFLDFPLSIPPIGQLFGTCILPKVHVLHPLIPALWRLDTLFYVPTSYSDISDKNPATTMPTALLPLFPLPLHSSGKANHSNSNHSQTPLTHPYARIGRLHIRDAAWLSPVPHPTVLRVLSTVGPSLQEDLKQIPHLAHYFLGVNQECGKDCSYLYAEEVSGNGSTIESKMFFRISHALLGATVFEDHFAVERYPSKAASQIQHLDSNHTKLTNTMTTTKDTAQSIHPHAKTPSSTPPKSSPSSPLIQSTPVQSFPSRNTDLGHWECVDFLPNRNASKSSTSSTTAASFFMPPPSKQHQRCTTNQSPHMRQQPEPLELEVRSVPSDASSSDTWHEVAPPSLVASPSDGEKYRYEGVEGIARGSADVLSQLAGNTAGGMNGTVLNHEGHREHAMGDNGALRVWEDAQWEHFQTIVPNLQECFPSYDLINVQPILNGLTFSISLSNVSVGIFPQQSLTSDSGSICLELPLLRLLVQESPWIPKAEKQSLQEVTEYSKRRSILIHSDTIRVTESMNRYYNAQRDIVDGGASSRKDDSVATKRPSVRLVRARSDSSSASGASYNLPTSNQQQHSNANRESHYAQQQALSSSSIASPLLLIQNPAGTDSHYPTNHPHTQFACPRAGSYPQHHTPTQFALHTVAHTPLHNRNPLEPFLLPLPRRSTSIDAPVTTEALVLEWSTMQRSYSTPLSRSVGDRMGRFVLLTPLAPWKQAGPLYESENDSTSESGIAAKKGNAGKGRKEGEVETRENGKIEPDDRDWTGVCSLQNKKNINVTIANVLSTAISTSVKDNGTQSTSTKGGAGAVTPDLTATRNNEDEEDGDGIDDEKYLVDLEEMFRDERAFAQGSVPLRYPSLFPLRTHHRPPIIEWRENKASPSTRTAPKATQSTTTKRKRAESLQPTHDRAHRHIDIASKSPLSPGLLYLGHVLPTAVPLQHISYKHTPRQVLLRCAPSFLPLPFTFGGGEASLCLSLACIEIHVHGGMLAWLQDRYRELTAADGANKGTAKRTVSKEEEVIDDGYATSEEEWEVSSGEELSCDARKRSSKHRDSRRTSCKNHHKQKEMHRDRHKHNKKRLIQRHIENVTTKSDINGVQRRKKSVGVEPEQSDSSGRREHRNARQKRKDKRNASILTQQGTSTAPSNDHLDMFAQETQLSDGHLQCLPQASDKDEDAICSSTTASPQQSVSTQPESQGTFPSQQQPYFYAQLHPPQLLSYVEINPTMCLFTFSPAQTKLHIYPPGKHRSSQSSNKNRSDTYRASKKEKKELYRTPTEPDNADGDGSSLQLHLPPITRFPLKFAKFQGIYLDNSSLGTEIGYHLLYCLLSDDATRNASSAPSSTASTLASFLPRYLRGTATRFTSAAAEGNTATSPYYSSAFGTNTTFNPAFDYPSPSYQVRKHGIPRSIGSYLPLAFTFARSALASIPHAQSLRSIVSASSTSRTSAGGYGFYGNAGFNGASNGAGAVGEKPLLAQLSLKKLSLTAVKMLASITGHPFAKTTAQWFVPLVLQLYTASPELIFLSHVVNVVFKGGSCLAQLLEWIASGDELMDRNS